ncbi:MAG: hypothetical protein R3F59_35295 [Myxococcota bacterium]
MRIPLALAALAACAPAPDGLRRTPPGSGPRVIVDFDAQPLPELPFPNDLATRPDPTSPTGLRPNLPVDALVRQENDAREGIDGLSGFGLFAPISVSFDAPLDVQAIVDRHPDDLWADAPFADDAILLVDVDPDSPERGRIVPLDLGSGRFPQDVTELGQFLPNDPRRDQPSLLFETAEEDVNGNGVLDTGEDTDGDGLLDHPNLLPGGTDPRLDLLTFYDRQSHTLIVRPVTLLREETTYAVVLTEALVGEDGEPVRSRGPVNHTRQTAALEPVVGALRQVGLGVDDIAFAWTFTTGSVTRELWDVAEGLRGNGPYRSLAEAYPAGVTEGHELHTNDADGDRMFLPVDKLLSPLRAIGYFPPESFDVLDAVYGAYAAGIVGGSFVGPDLLVDKDDGGLDDADEHWVLDPQRGTAIAGPRRITFTCIVPKETGENKPPWPIAIHAHGYGSTRVEFFGFAHALVRHGIAACGIDAPGHGLPLGPDELELVSSLLELTGTEPAWWHILQDRRRDLDNDGLADPGADMFSADAFHTRDMMRQAVLDWTQLIRSLQACGSGTMERVTPTSEGNVHSGEQVVSCDFDGDGAPDLGGPDTKFLMDGISQGGILTGVSIAVNPADTAVLTVPGGGLADIGGRTDISGVANAMVGRAISPIVVGEPRFGGGVELRQVVISVDKAAVLPFGEIDALPVGGRVVVRNLDLDVEDSGLVPADGRFRVPIPANALDPGEKRIAAQIPDLSQPDAPQGPFGVPDNAGLGDRLQVDVLDAQGQLVARYDTFDRDVLLEGVTYPAGSPLVAGSWGLGDRRGSRELQQLVGALAIGIEGADPIAYVRHWEEEPFDGRPNNVLVHLTIGDTTVPSSTGIALARADGLVDYTAIDPRYGSTVDRWLIDRGTVRGMEEFGPWTDPSGRKILFDPDDLDNGTDGSGAPSDAPLRSQRQAATGLHGLRFLYVNPTGSHAYFLPDERLPFDWSLFGVQQMAQYLATDGTDINDDPCLATRDCPFLQPVPEGP